jgi:hypothetical protein
MLEAKRARAKKLKQPTDEKMTPSHLSPYRRLPSTSASSIWHRIVSLRLADRQVGGERCLVRHNHLDEVYRTQLAMRIEGEVVKRTNVVDLVPLDIHPLQKLIHLLIRQLLAKTCEDYSIPSSAPSRWGKEGGERGYRIAALPRQ